MECQSQKQTTFGSMLLSGKKGAEVAMHKLKETPEQPKLKVKWLGRQESILSYKEVSR